ncbi:SURF1 family protein [Pelagibacterium sp. 26DY04]|uniref:SURF1 family protein n=1 Tax=Pelagibacterium sp. 26DY04 TaxID=2967130 RepID=UPI002815735B|nr:SURF1 family protein [Pelagibacterium sp. 26DY04]WMT87842.1 SURF1 family protein [Pelagibacterium sp. 26DY04]
MIEAVRPQRRWSLGQISFVVLMLVLMALFITLGNWQVQRLGEKEALIAAVEERFDQPAAAFPEQGSWAGLDAEALDYRPVTATGTYDHARTVLIFTNLPDPVGRYGGVGYWVMAPFTLEDGGVVWVNRGFVPEAVAESYADGGDGPQGTTTIEGVARRPEQPNSFTPASDLDARREWVRDPERLAAFLDPGVPVAPVTIDLVAGPAGELPQGGETQITFPNRHLEYAGTWYLFAAITPVMLGFWIWRQRKSRNLAPEEKGN